MRMREDVLKLAGKCGCNVTDGYGLPSGIAVYREEPVTNMLERFYIAATLQAAERVKEEAAQVCTQAERSPWAGEYEAGYVAGYNSAVVEISKAIRAIDANKLFGE